jgi:hypothetical protein
MQRLQLKLDCTSESTAARGDRIGDSAGIDEQDAPVAIAADANDLRRFGERVHHDGKYSQRG